MIYLDIQRLSDENRHLIDGFSCVETDEMLSGLNAKERRRVWKHSQDMENYAEKTCNPLEVLVQYICILLPKYT